MPKGLSQNIILAIAGVLIIGLAIAYSTFTLKVSAPIEDGSEIPTTSEPTGEPTSTPTGETETPTPKPPVSQPTTPVPTPPVSGGGAVSPPTATTPPPSGGTEVPSTTPPAPTEPAPTPQAWSPGFQADSRVFAAIPSENQRATLPACNGNSVLPFDVVDMANVTSITPTGGGSPYDHLVLTMVGKGEYYEYDLVAPGDVYITNIVQEFGVTEDSEDTTIYFALCRDVFGYVTNVKEMSPQVYELVTDSYCLGKPQTGPNACKIEVMELVGKSSSWGKVGVKAGYFGLGIIDLRKQRALENPAQYSIRMNFAACPSSYFAEPTRYTAKLTSTNSLCTGL